MQNRMHHIIIASLSVYPVIPWQRQVLWKQNTLYYHCFPVCLSVLIYQDRDKYYENRMHHIIIASLSVYPVIPWQRQVLWKQDASYNYYFPVCLSVLLFHDRDKYYENRIHNFFIASLSVCLACYTMIKTETNILKTGGIILLPYVRNNIYLSHFNNIDLYRKTYYQLFTWPY